MTPAARKRIEALAARIDAISAELREFADVESDGEQEALTSAADSLDEAASILGGV
jgi:C4-dicarboxylate-specific signal transduction histidine kinase